ncbi:MAG: type II toxin-antitoxin system RelE/ParE family toxin [Limnobacter sp.]|uniref:type II toxin-antitoxin system RelE/ParE family toxin n=1 Tax=Limnobacter sp. TaxID=2003368 RepID=UPI0032ECB965
MINIVWANPALDQLEAILEYIAMDKPLAAKKLAGNVFLAVDRLAQFPNSGRIPPELNKGVYREIVCPPLRVFYRANKKQILIVHVMREEQQLRRYLLNVKDEQ